jgi:F-type H+-transporting ATPase subunit b
MGETRASIEIEKNTAIREIRNVAVELSVQIAEKLLRNELTKDKKQKELIEQLIKDVPVN